MTNVQNVDCYALSTVVLPVVYFRMSTLKERKSHEKYAGFSVLSIPLCSTRPTKIRISVSQSYAICTRNDVSLTPVQLVKNKHRFLSGAIGQVMLHESALCT